MMSHTKISITRQGEKYVYYNNLFGSKRSFFFGIGFCDVENNFFNLILSIIVLPNSGDKIYETSIAEVVI